MRIEGEEARNGRVVCRCRWCVAENGSNSGGGRETKGQVRKILILLPLPCQLVLNDDDDINPRRNPPALSFRCSSPLPPSRLLGFFLSLSRSLVTLSLSLPSSGPSASLDLCSARPFPCLSSLKSGSVPSRVHPSYLSSVGCLLKQRRCSLRTPSLSSPRHSTSRRTSPSTRTSIRSTPTRFSRTSDTAWPSGTLSSAVTARFAGGMALFGTRVRARRAWPVATSAGLD